MKGKTKTGLILIVASAVVGAILPIPFVGTLLFVIGLVFLLVGLASGSAGPADSKQAQAFSDGYKYSFMNSDTAIAVSPERKIVRLKSGGVVKDYPFADVRNWETHLLTGGDIVATSATVQGGLAAVGANRRNAQMNKAGSGLFVNVRDIDHPSWRIVMLNKADQNRWVEILQQLINEGA